jgi:CTP:molybdopterin cytidylyltransferase MocA
VSGEPSPAEDFGGLGDAKSSARPLEPEAGPGSGIAGLLLAAGAGRRLGRPKALVELGGTTLAARGVELLRAGGTDPVFIVTGAADVEIPGVQTVWNPDWVSGMGSSLRAGLAALAASPASAAAVVVALVDQPLIGPAAVSRLIGAFRQGAELAAASYEGKRRNPVLFARRHWAAVAAAAEADLGARGFLRANRELITLVECGDVGRPDDLDTAEDLARIATLMTTPAKFSQ